MNSILGNSIIWKLNLCEFNYWEFNRFLFIRFKNWELKHNSIYFAHVQNKTEKDLQKLKKTAKSTKKI